MIKTGTEFEQTFEVTESLYKGFIELFQDRNPLHTDRQFAQGFGFAQVVLHGNILNGFLSFFVGQCLPEKNVMIINQSIDYHQPVFVNDSLTLFAEVKHVSEGLGLTEFKYKFVNQENTRVAKGKISIKDLI